MYEYEWNISALNFLNFLVHKNGRQSSLASKVQIIPNLTCNLLLFLVMWLSCVAKVSYIKYANWKKNLRTDSIFVSRHILVCAYNIILFGGDVDVTWSEIRLGAVRKRSMSLLLMFLVFLPLRGLYGKMLMD